MSDATILGQMGRTGHTNKFHFLILLLINSKKKNREMRNQKRGEGACNGEGQEEREHSNNLGLMQWRGDSAVLG